MRKVFKLINEVVNILSKFAKSNSSKATDFFSVLAVPNMYLDEKLEHNLFIHH